MTRRLDIKKIHDASYSHLRKETDNFKKPVICTLSERDISAVQELKNILMNQESYHNFFHSNNAVKKHSESVIDYSNSEWEEYDTNTFIFLTKDKVISPVELVTDKYVDALEKIVNFFFTTSFFKERLADAGVLKRWLIFSSLKKGIFGKFSLGNFSNLVNISTWYSHGNTNTFVHSDHALSNMFLQIVGTKRWWLASPYQRKDMLQEVFNTDITKLDLNNTILNEFEYYDFELKSEEILYVPANWLHSVVAPKGLNLSLSCRFPIGLKEALINMMYWKSLGVPLNSSKKSTSKDDISLSEVRADQAESFNNLKFYLRKHQFSRREILNEEPEFVYGLYDVDTISKTVAGAE